LPFSRTFPAYAGSISPSLDGSRRKNLQPGQKFPVVEVRRQIALAIREEVTKLKGLARR
jgi:hypothetical protein